MIFIIGVLSMIAGFALESKYKYVTRLRATKVGHHFLGSKLSIYFTEVFILMILAALVAVFELSMNQFDIIGGIVIGQLIAILLIANREGFK